MEWKQHYLGGAPPYFFSVRTGHSDSFTTDFVVVVVQSNPIKREKTKTKLTSMPVKIGIYSKLRF